MTTENVGQARQGGGSRVQLALIVVTVGLIVLSIVLFLLFQQTSTDLENAEASATAVANVAATSDANAALSQEEAATAQANQLNAEASATAVENRAATSDANATQSSIEAATAAANQAAAEEEAATAIANQFAAEEAQATAEANQAAAEEAQATAEANQAAAEASATAAANAAATSEANAQQSAEEAATAQAAQEAAEAGATAAANALATADANAALSRNEAATAQAARAQAEANATVMANVAATAEANAQAARQQANQAQAQLTAVAQAGPGTQPTPSGPGPTTAPSNVVALVAQVLFGSATAAPAGFGDTGIELYLDQTVIDLTGEDNFIRWTRFGPTYTDFAIGATIAWGPGATEDECGFLFRELDPTVPNNLYTLRISRNGELWFIPRTNGSWGQAVRGGGGNLIRTGRSDTNELLLVAVGSEFTVFINGQLAHRFTDSSITSGRVAVMAATQDESDVTNCTFTNVFGWDLSQVSTQGTPPTTNTNTTTFQPANVATTSFTSDDGTYTFQYPSTWFLVFDLGERSVATNNVGASIQILDENPTPDAGNFWVFVSIFELGAVNDLAGFLDGSLRQNRPTDTFGAPVNFSIQTQTGATRRVGYVDVTNANQRFLLVDIGNGFFGLLAVNALTNEVDGYMSEILVIAATLERQAFSS